MICTTLTLSWPLYYCYSLLCVPYSQTLTDRSAPVSSTASNALTVISVGTLLYFREARIARNVCNIPSPIPSTLPRTIPSALPRQHSSLSSRSIFRMTKITSQIIQRNHSSVILETEPLDTLPFALLEYFSSSALSSLSDTPIETTVLLITSSGTFCAIREAYAS